MRTVVLTRALAIDDANRIVIDGDVNGDGLADTTITGEVDRYALRINFESDVKLQVCASPTSSR